MVLPGSWARTTPAAECSSTTVTAAATNRRPFIGSPLFFREVPDSAPRRRPAAGPASRNISSTGAIRTRSGLTATTAISVAAGARGPAAGAT